MNLSDITTQPYILALFKRDDGTRFLLGLGAYEFKDSQQHFIANTMVNDVVDMQGTDGALLAGQVRRASTQSFDGYVGDGGVIKSTVEQYRKDFIAYFQKNHFYTVVYIFADGTAIQRKRGYIIDSPEVKELYQMTPEYHVALNFEDVNYYKYAENSDGDEIYSNTANITSKITTTGGLVWSMSAVPIAGEGTRFTLYGTLAEENLQSVQLKGQTSQPTYSGKNLVYTKAGIDGGITFSYDSSTGATTITGQQSYGFSLSQQVETNLPAGTYTVSIDAPQEVIIGVGIYDSSDNRTAEEIAAGQTSLTFTAIAPIAKFETIVAGLDSGTTYNLTFKLQLESGSVATTFEPYVGGIASPNPDYPQTIHTVSGEQTITISGGNSQSQSYTVNLGKNLFDISTQPTWTVGNTTSSVSDGIMTVSGDYAVGILVDVTPNTEYTISCITEIITSGGSISGNIRVYSSKKVWISNDNTFNSGSNSQVYLNFYAGGGSNGVVKFSNIQLEKGSTATTYAPYFTPIELCKIGTYQDYIYKSNGDWYVHKEIGYKAVATSDIYAVATQYTNVSYYNFAKPSDYAGYGNYKYYPVTCSHAIFAGSPSGGWDTADAISKGYTAAGANWIWIGFTKGTTLAQAQTALDGIYFYYALATPTDTQITDVDLIADLEDLLGADTYSPSTAFGITATNNLPAWLSISAHSGSGGVVWDNIGATWEEGGEGGDSFVTVDSITDVFPTITIIGSAHNPKITNITTGQVLQYAGNVASGQKLVIDVQQKTAKLSGTSVITNVSGDWLYLKPGMNRIAYTIDNSTVNYATIEWQEITG